MSIYIVREERYGAGNIVWKPVALFFCNLRPPALWDHSSRLWAKCLAGKFPFQIGAHFIIDKPEIFISETWRNREVDEAEAVLLQLSI